MKVALVVCLLAATAVAAPRYPRTSRLAPTLAPTVKTAEDAWSAAEAEPDPAKQPALWERAAAAFAAVDDAPVDAKVKRDAAFAAVLAWKNALAVDPRPTKPPGAHHRDATPTPRPLPAREQGFVAALARYASYADAADPELPGVLYLQATTYADFDQLDLAIPLFLAIVDRHRDSAVTEFAALLLLDTYNRLGRFDALIALADRLAKDAKFLDGRDDLATVVRQIQRQSKRRRAEELERTASDTNDRDAYHAAGMAYLDIYNASPEAADSEEVLYNAGVSFEYARSLSAAIQAYSLVERSYAKSRVAMRATARLAHIYADIAMFDRAAEKLEQYAKRYAGEKDALDALSDAVYYRKAIGDRDKAIEDSKYFIKTFGARKPDAAAEVMWSITSLYEGDAAVTHLRDYLRMFGTKVGAERTTVARAKIGLLLWARSCPHATVDGLCVTSRTVARTCGAGTVSTWTVTPRNNKASTEARAALADAVKQTPDDAMSRYFVAQARVALADAELEPYLALAFPTNLTFPADTKRFGEWIDAKQQAAVRLNRAYEVVFALKDPSSSITAAGRVAMITHAFATTILTGELPRDVRTSAAAKQAYCDKLTEVAEPLAARALVAFGVCLAKSTELAWFGDASALCERALIELAPAEFPARRELSARADAFAPVIAAEPPVAGAR